MTLEQAARYKDIAAGLDPAAMDYAAVMARAFAQTPRLARRQRRARAAAPAVARLLRRH
jgi:hypothetical protein